MVRGGRGVGGGGKRAVAKWKQHLDGTILGS